MTSDILVDALPYIDQGYDEPGVREAVSFLMKIHYLIRFKYNLGVTNGGRRNEEV